ncbi:MAG TPA: cell division protein FtsB [Casimicrobiaceae bacterium]
MRWLALAFAALILVLQYPMWLGKGGWLQVREYDRQLAAQREANEKLQTRNDALDADVRDLKTGYEAIEERARAELGMIRNDEVFFQIQSGGAGVKPAATARAAPPRR